MVKNKKFLKSHNIILSYGKDGTGDLYKLKNKNFAKTTKKVS